MESGRSSERENKVINEYLDDILTEEEQPKEVLVVETYQTTLYNNKVKLQLRISARVIVTENETPSGKRYEWERAGAIVEVDEEDAPVLLTKALGNKACCGGDTENLKLFVKLE